jgi:hypothetical protein
LYGTALPVQVTRLHVRYDNNSFPEDLMFQETGDSENFQGRYVLRHAWEGSPQQCPAAKEYFRQLAIRHEQEAETLAELTGWNVEDIQRKINQGNQGYFENADRNSTTGTTKNLPKSPTKSQWWRNIW